MRPARRGRYNSTSPFVFVSSQSSSRGAAANPGVKQCPPRDAARWCWLGSLRERVHRWVTVFRRRLRQQFGGRAQIARPTQETPQLPMIVERAPRGQVRCRAERDRGAVERADGVRRVGGAGQAGVRS